MQREIKFRAWHKGTKTMCDVISLDFDTQEIYIYIQGTATLTWFDCVEKMEYTGLLDMNATELYECDIITDGVFNYIIKWIDFRFWKVQIGQLDEYKSMLYGVEHYTKVGTIYDNPELLQEVDK